MRKILTILACLLFLNACASDPPAPVQQESDTGPRINLDVLTLVVLDRSMPLTSGTPYASNNFQPTIANAVRRWATDKLVAVGSTGEAVLVIKDASLKADLIPHSDSWFTREQASKYTGNVEVELSVARRNEHGQVVATASHYETLPELPSALERNNAYNKVLNAVMKELSANLRGGVKDHLANFVTAETPAPAAPAP